MIGIPRPIFYLTICLGQASNCRWLRLDVLWMCFMYLYLNEHLKDCELWEALVEEVLRSHQLSRPFTEPIPVEPRSVPPFVDPIQFGHLTSVIECLTRL